MDTGRLVLDLAPMKTNPRNSEGSFIRMPSGEIAFAYSRYRDGLEDGSVCDLAVMFSKDEGESFSKERVFLTCEECCAKNIMSVSLLPLKDGNIGIFYLKKESKNHESKS